MKWVVLATLLAGSLVQDRAPEVRTRSGLVRGALSPDGLHYAYFGLPYGIVDHSNRFQAPYPPPTWDGVFDAVDENIRCPQKFFGDTVIGDPNCLSLNVYTPIHQADKPLAVMVFIHGGCFFEGTGSTFLYGGDYFAEHNVVFVGINYRLNVEGFLCLGIAEAPGNAGLKDQIAALRWVRDNIAAFGGDPDNVTLFGESAGAVSTSLLVLTPSARGLFHRVIMQSGSSLAPWALQHDPIKTASSLVKEFGYNTKDPYKIYNILSKKTVEELIGAVKHAAPKTYITARTLFVPCVENHIDGVEPVLTEYPGDIIKSGNYTKVPMIIGYNDNEGLYFVGQDYGTTVDHINPLDVLQEDLIFPSEEDKQSIAKEIRDHYFAPNEQALKGTVELYSDLHFKYPAVVEADLYAQTTDQPMYHYLFKYSGLVNMPKMIVGFWAASGASHADELFYLFQPHAFPLPQRRLEARMMTRMLRLWTNFAKYSEPTPAFTKDEIRWSRAPDALVIDAEPRCAQARNLHPSRAALRLWDAAYARYRRRHYGFTHPGGQTGGALCSERNYSSCSDMSC